MRAWKLPSIDSSSKHEEARVLHQEVTRINKHTHSARKRITASLWTDFLLSSKPSALWSMSLMSWVELFSPDWLSYMLIHSVKTSNDTYSILPREASLNPIKLTTKTNHLRKTEELTSRGCIGSRKGNITTPFQGSTGQNFDLSTHPDSGVFCIVRLCARRTCNRFIEYQTTFATNLTIYLYSTGEFLSFGWKLQSTYKHLSLEANHSKLVSSLCCVYFSLFVLLFGSVFYLRHSPLIHLKPVSFSVAIIAIIHTY